MRVRIRFSLRSLLLLTVVVAGGCYWMALPSVYAQRFVTAVAAGDYAAADALFADPDDRFLEQWDNDYTIIQRRAQVEPSSWRERWRGERQISVRLIYRTPVRTNGYVARIVATRGGLGSPQVWSGGSSLGGGLAARRIPPPYALPFPPYESPRH